MQKKKNTRRSPKRRRRKPPKRVYRRRNWKEYNAALVARGSLALWLEAAVVTGWLNAQRSGHRGASNTYSDPAIAAALMLKAVYRLPLRATQGLLPKGCCGRC